MIFQPEKNLYLFLHFSNHPIYRKMNYLDIIIGLILILSAFRGLKKGLIAELTSLAAIIFGILGAINFSHISDDFLMKHFNLESGNLNIVSFITTFIVIVILVHIVGNSVSKLVQAVMLGWFNKAAGLVFGVLRSALVIGVILLLFDTIDKDMHILSPKVKSESRLYEPVKNFAPSILPFFEEWIKDLGINKKENDPVKQFKDGLKMS